MKLSISVPDDLWQTVAVPSDSPSEVVQRALRAIARREHPPAQAAPTPELVERLRPRVQSAADRLRIAQLRLRDLGYEAGVAMLSNEHGALDDVDVIEFLREWGGGTLDEIASVLNEQLDEVEYGQISEVLGPQHGRTARQRAIQRVLLHAAYDAGLEQWGGELNYDFMCGVAQAVLDAADALMLRGAP